MGRRSKYLIKNNWIEMNCNRADLVDKFQRKNRLCTWSGSLKAVIQRYSVRQHSIPKWYWHKITLLPVMNIYIKTHENRYTGHNNRYIYICMSPYAAVTLLIDYCWAPFSTIVQSYHGGQFTYHCESWLTHAITTHKNISKKLAAFLHMLLVYW